MEPDLIKRYRWQSLYAEDPALRLHAQDMVRKAAREKAPKLPDLQVSMTNPDDQALSRRIWSTQGATVLAHCPNDWDEENGGPNAVAMRDPENWYEPVPWSLIRTVNGGHAVVVGSPGNETLHPMTADGLVRDPRNPDQGPREPYDDERAAHAAMDLYAQAPHKDVEPIEAAFPIATIERA